ncbi:MAG: hypothetical protein ACW987_14055 [Candidatus Thorarchaeota archaeon]
MKQFFVFRCPKCKNFTNAPAGQKRRRCSYCGTIIDITKAACALFDSPAQASNAVKEFNATRGGDEFQKSVDRSRERVLSLMPKETVKVSDISDGEKIPKPPGKRKRLLTLLEREARRGKPRKRRYHLTELKSSALNTNSNGNGLRGNSRECQTVDLSYFLDHGQFNWLSQKTKRVEVKQ